jgi:hypothetical protein
LLFFIVANTLATAQVYHYMPLTYMDAEINPSVVLSDRYKAKQMIQHANSFSQTNPFSISRITLQKKLDRIFCGTALTLANVNQQNHTFNYAALSFAYRTILFDELYLRAGVTGKLIQNNAGPGYFDLFSFHPDENSGIKQFSGNFNYNFSITSSLERYYVSFSMLNHQPFAPTDSVLFPVYYQIQAGNLASLINRSLTNNVISFSYFSKKGNDGRMERNYYTNLFFEWKLSRKASMLFGGRTGYSSEKYFNFIPSICFLNSNFMVTVSYSFYTSQPVTTYFVPSFQTQLNLNLWSEKNSYQRGVYF